MMKAQKDPMVRRCNNNGSHISVEVGEQEGSRGLDLLRCSLDSLTSKYLSSLHSNPRLDFKMSISFLGTFLVTISCGSLLPYDLC